MFRPSPSLLFRPMPVLKKLKIHLPLPLTPRESKRLLDILTTSFRQQLDTEHPTFRTNSNTESSREHLSTSRLRRSSLSDRENTPTDRHMHSLLTNPLFNVRNETVRLPIDPMDIFTQAVAKGMMTTTYAKALLTAKKAQIVQSAVLNIRDGMKDSGAGMQVLKWLVSSGTASTTDFLKDVEFVRILMEYMVAEGLQESAWKWVKKSLESFPALSLLPDKEFTQALKQAIGPLLFLIRAEAAGSGSPASLDAAYMALSRAAGYLGGLPKSDLIRLLGPPGWYLIRASLLPRSSRPPPSEAAFESFLSLIPVVSKNPKRNLAHLSLLHPTKPNPDLALNYIESLQAKRKRMGPASKAATLSDHQNIQLGLDAAKTLLVQHRYTEADQVMEFLRSNYPRQLGIKETRQLEQARAEASSLELLERLGLA